MAGDVMPDGRRATAVARALLEVGAISLTPGSPVTFKSGLRSPVYVDNRRLISAPGAWHVVIEAFAGELRGGDAASTAVPGDPVVIAGVESAGIPHSSALAYSLGWPSVFVRKDARDHGLGRRIEGGDVAGRAVVLVEDMVTTGGSSLSAVAALRAAGASVERCLAIITYGFPESADAFSAAGVSLEVLTSFETVLAAGLAGGSIDGPAAASVRGWLADPRAWVPA